MEIISRKNIKTLLKKRNVKTHKGTYGKVLIIAGSEGMAGAAVLSARGALRSGAGLVRVSIDKKLFPIVQSSVVEAVCVDRDLSKEKLDEYDSIVIGPGIGTSGDGAYAFAKVTGNYNGNVIMDADALNIAADNDIDLKKSKGNLIITPHQGEAARLMKTSSGEITGSRGKAVSFLAEYTGAVTVLKGYETLICLPRNDEEEEVKLFMNSTGNPGMSTAGSGDVLSGIIGSFLGQGMSPEDAAKAGVYVHGLAGDLASKDIGEYGTMAGDIAEYTAKAIKAIQEDQ